MSQSEVVALVGAPNSGKTTLYNWLTNSKFKTVNYPGATVDYSIGELAPQYSGQFLVMDTPGTYSLFPKSSDEEVTLNSLLAHPEYGAIKKVVVVIDGTQLSRNLLMLRQIYDSGFSMVIGITMTDLLRKNKIELDSTVLAKEFNCQVVLLEGLLGGGVRELVAAIKTMIPRAGHALPSWSEELLSANLRRGEDLAKKVLSGSSTANIFALTQKIDRLVLHPIWGSFIFILVMLLMFSSIFWLAKPFMELVSGGFDQLALLVRLYFTPGLLTDFFADGILKGFGAVMVFVPQIFILFFAIGLLEATGYLARAATIVDTPFSKLGMSGRSFVPLLSGFACAVPAIMATRNISNPRDRMITNFVIPMMTCSARLPVYALLLSLVFFNSSPWLSGLVLTGLYLFSLFTGSLAAAILNQLVKKSGQSLFMMELPMYRRPVLRALLAACFQKTKSYIIKAGPMIFMFSVLIWLGTNFPQIQVSSEQAPLSQAQLATAQMEQSYLGRLGKVIEPIFTPMGGDWRTGVGLLSAFVARETFVSSVAVLFVSEARATNQDTGLIEELLAAKNQQGQALFTISSVLGLIVFFALAMQCLSTFAIQVKENGSRWFAWSQLIGLNLIAYLLSVGAVQGLRALGLP